MSKAPEKISTAQDGRPDARPTAPPATARPRPFGVYRGRICFAEDFEAPWPADIRRALEGVTPIEPDGAPPG